MPTHFSGHYSNWFCGSGTFVPWPFGMVLTLLLWGLAIFLVVKVIQAFIYPKTVVPPSTLGVLQERYARGEIDAATYQRLKKEMD